MSFEIVRVDVDSIHLLDKVAEEVFDHAIDPKHLAAYLADPKNIMFVAVSDGVVVGQARGMRHLQPDQAPDFYIDNLGVAPDHKRKGIATALMNALIAAGTGGDVTDVWLGTEADNDEAVGFYRAYGFLETKMVMFANFEED